MPLQPFEVQGARITWWGLAEKSSFTAVSNLATGNSPYSTGKVIMVDGGLTIPRL